MTHPAAETAAQSYWVVFNPVSGTGQPGDKLTEIQSALESLCHLTVRLTKPDLSAAQIAQDAVAAGADVVIAAGGDGTVSGVASALVDTDVALGIIPTGTANAFASALNIPESVLDACDIIQTGQHQRVDTAWCNDRLMLLVACIGFEAELLDRMDREEKSQLGKLAIVTNSLKELRDVRQFETQLETPDDQWHEPATAVTIANAATVDMVLAQGPAAVTADDGNLSITLVTPEHQWGVVKSAANLFLSALQERTVDNDTVHSWQVPQVKVHTDPAQAVFVDGEPAGETPLTVKCHPRSLSVLIPSPAEGT
ncbi:YegS/Rv2252/BmrU family lipid kinase [Leptolyngbya iicbica]|uniref:YegS/Rv2252/BmrU family lipid kinase n=2 Tax=Cyanophyceae TaxID=3028117 RepID=A0A4V2E2N3_9CYAN|nr:YegS/Rv2252/BmrU family lipid kinase [Leptolyngbya sp. LK]RZM79156.1 YegS/Rv2252/BmrU family lipid kinase [Leptolyngbya sp. LK]